MELAITIFYWVFAVIVALSTFCDVILHGETRKINGWSSVVTSTLIIMLMYEAGKLL